MRFDVLKNVLAGSSTLGLAALLAATGFVATPASAQESGEAGVMVI
jgi:hypothetical protein